MSDVMVDWLLGFPFATMLTCFAGLIYIAKSQSDDEKSRMRWAVVFGGFLISSIILFAALLCVYFLSVLYWRGFGSLPTRN